MNVLPFERSTRPHIRVDSDIHIAIAQASDAIGAHPDVFQRDGKLVQIIRAPELDPLVAAGASTLREIPHAALLPLLSESATFDNFDQRRHEWVRIRPPVQVVAGVMTRGAWPRVRRIVGVIEAPAMRPDGSVLQDRGYDMATGYFYEPSDDFPAIALAPTQDDARRALQEIEAIFSDFPFASAAERSVVVAGLLTMLGRPSIRGSTPGFICDANTRGSGKTLLADVVSKIATGRLTAKMAYPPDDVELEKVLAAYALRASPLVNFDNVTRPFGGGPLDRCLTAVDAVELRVLGKSEIQTLDWRSVIFATGNNIALTGDTARRVLIARLESTLEHPEDRTNFCHPHLLEHVGEIRTRLVNAGLTVLRAWHVAKRPRMGCGTWGSFEAWSEMIPPAIVFAGGADPMLARRTASGEEDVEKAALVVLLEGWSRLAGAEGIAAARAIDVLYPARRGQGPPDGYDDLREAIETLVTTPPGKPPSAPQLAGALRRFKRRVVGSKMFDVIQTREKVGRWRVVSS